MALIKCSNCGQMISDKADKCPKCGKALQENITPQISEESKGQSRSNKSLYVLIAVGIAIVAGIGLFLALNRKTDIKVENVISGLSKGNTLASSRSDIELLGFDGKIKILQWHPEWEQYCEYYFNESGELISCKNGDECGFIQYHFNKGRLVSSNGESGEAGEDRIPFNNIYNYESSGDKHEIIYETNTQTSEKKKFAEVYYDEKGRIIQIKRNENRGEITKNITYDNDNNPYDENGDYTVVGIELVGITLVRADGYEKDEERSSESIANYINRENYNSIEVTYWE